MAYTPTTWTNDTPASSPVKYIITDDSAGVVAASATIAPVTSITPGTPINATNLNNIENGIVTLESDLAAAVADIAAGVPDIFTTKGDLAVATAADTAARLGVGANNTILMADSAATPGVKWANRASGLLTAKGDIFTASASATAARLAVGTTGQYMVPNAGESTGLKWVTMINTGRHTNASWDGDDKAASTTYTITVTTDYSIPSGAKMVLVWLSAAWITINLNSEMYFTKVGDTSARYLSARGQVTGIYFDASGWVPVAADDTITLITGSTDPSSVIVEISAYML
jgi:hypothetical protein